MKIRKAIESDAKGLAKVHVDSWRTTYANIIPDEYLKNLSYENREKMWTSAIPHDHVFVAEDENGTVVGFSSGGKERSGQYKGFDGEIYSIYILKEHQGKGIGKALVHASVDYLKLEGLNSMIVLVLEDNISCKFYEALGGKKIDTVEIEIAGNKYAELVYGWDDLSQFH